MKDGSKKVVDKLEEKAANAAGEAETQGQTTAELRKELAEAQAKNRTYANKAADGGTVGENAVTNSLPNPGTEDRPVVELVAEPAADRLLFFRYWGYTRPGR